MPPALMFKAASTCGNSTGVCPVDVPLIAGGLNRQGVEIDGRVAGVDAAGDPLSATFAPARLIPQFESHSLSEQHGIPRQKSKITQIGWE